jgi:hypothetical protein
MRTILSLLVLMSLFVAAQADKGVFNNLSGDRVYTWADTVGGGEIDTVDLTLPANIDINFLSVSAYTVPVSGDSDSVSVSYLTFPLKKVSVVISGTVPDTFKLNADLVAASSLPIPVAWRLIDGSESPDGNLLAKNRGYFISYVDTKDAGGNADEWQPNTCGVVRWFVSTPDTRKVKLMLIVEIR